MADNKVSLDVESDELSCQICMEEFGEGPKCPRMLLCSHCFCHSCIETLISRKPICPLCRETLDFKKAEKFPVCFPVLRLMESYQKSQAEKKDVISSEMKKTTRQTNVLSEGFCEEHETTKQFKCMDCSDWVCGTCASLHHKKCRTLLVKEALREMQNEEVRKINDTFKIKLSTDKNFPEMTEILRQGVALLITETTELQLELKKKNKNLVNLQWKLQNFLLQRERTQKLWIPVEKSEMKKIQFVSNAQFKNAKYQLDSDLRGFREHIQDLMKIPSEISTIVDFKTVKYWLENNIEMRVQDGFQFSRLELYNEKLKIHCFQNNQPKHPFINIAFQDFLSFTTGSGQLPTKAFFEIGPRGATSGQEVIIQTDAAVAGSPRVQNFLLLVSGLNGASYKWMPLDLDIDKDDYPTKYVTVTSVWQKGGKEVTEPVVKGIEDFGIYGKSNPKRGFVCGSTAKSNSSSVYFFLQKSRKYFPVGGKFGVVESGMEAFDQMKSGKECYVINCGFIINET